MTLDFVLLVSSCLCFVCAALGVPSTVNLQSLGLALWVLTLLV